MGSGGGGMALSDGGHVITVERLMPVMPFLRRDIQAISYVGKKIRGGGRRKDWGRWVRL